MHIPLFDPAVALAPAPAAAAPTQQGLDFVGRLVAEGRAPADAAERHRELVKRARRRERTLGSLRASDLADRIGEKETALLNAVLAEVRRPSEGFQQVCTSLQVAAPASVSVISSIAFR